VAQVTGARSGRFALPAAEGVRHFDKLTTAIALQNGLQSYTFVHRKKSRWKDTVSQHAAARAQSACNRVDSAACSAISHAARPRFLK
jgi:hypothetical protein